MIDDGVIKFSFSKFQLTSAIDQNEFRPIEEAREKLFSLNLIGEYLPEEIGFGNISIRKDYSSYEETDFPQFLITGTQTGRFKSLDGNHYTRVVDGSLEKQSLACFGPLKASSESLTHAGIYRACSSINAIVHVHHSILWKELLKRDYPRTKKETPYGTKEMSDEVAVLLKQEKVGIIVMEGHQDGVIFYGSTMEEANKLALDSFHLLVT